MQGSDMVLADVLKHNDFIKYYPRAIPLDKVRHFVNANTHVCHTYSPLYCTTIVAQQNVAHYLRRYLSHVFVATNYSRVHLVLHYFVQMADRACVCVSWISVCACVLTLSDLCSWVSRVRSDRIRSS